MGRVNQPTNARSLCDSSRERGRRFRQHACDLQLTPTGHARPDGVRKPLDLLAAVAQNQDAFHRFAAEQLALAGKAFRTGEGRSLHAVRVEQSRGCIDTGVSTLLFAS